jgi:RNA polymerase sigma-70 factor (ECF subfamily)
MVERDVATFSGTDPRVGESEPPDEALIAAAREGDADAFERLLKRHEGRVLRVLRLLGVPAADREDVAQEIFVRVFRHLGGFRPGNPFSGWIYRITVNAVHDYRRRARRAPREDFDADAVLENAPDSAPDPEQSVELSHRQRLLEEAMARLSERERAVFVLREIEGMETRQVARALRITTITVRRHLSRARSRLRCLLDSAQKIAPRR